MAEENKAQPVVIDSATFSPAAANTFRYQGREYKAFNILQVRRGTRNKFAELDAHIKACNSVDEQTDLLLSIIAEFVPAAPIDELREEPWELLLQVVIRLGNAVGTDGEERPTTGQEK